MKEFDVAVETSDIVLQFACDPVKTIPFSGRVKSVENLGSATISVNYMAIATCLRMDACTGPCGPNCGGPQIVGIATAEVAADGAFKMALPDFSDDPIVADDSSAEIGLHGVLNIPLLEPESSQAPWLKVAASYPSEVTFVPVEWKDPSKPR